MTAQYFYNEVVQTKDKNFFENIFSIKKRQKQDFWAKNCSSV